MRENRTHGSEGGEDLHVLLYPYHGHIEKLEIQLKAEVQELLTFLVTASGLTLWGVGSAFWGLLLGLAVLKSRAPR